MLIKKAKKNNIRFIDLFAGIGGFRIALSSTGAECVFSNDYEKNACLTYSANFGEILCKDIHDVSAADIPSFDILCGGFPCQPFSIAGVSKKNSMGIKHGFDDKKQGNLFFEVMRIVKHHNPGVVFLENVKNLKSHDKGRTWKTIKDNIEGAGYYVFDKIIDGKFYVPQHRERIFIVCFNKKQYPKINFDFPASPQKRIYELSDAINDSVHEKYTLSDKLWNYLKKHKENSQAKGSGFGYGLIRRDKDAYTRTISARYYKDGSEVLIYQEDKNPRRLTPREAAKLQGFPSDFKIPVSDTQAYRQFGNSVVVPAVQATAKKIVQTLEEYQKGGARSNDLTLFD